jgi:hypothetical protein
MYWAVKLVLALLLSPVALATDDPRLAQSREIAARFQKELSGKLMSAMSAGGPVLAITVCNKDAPAIAARLSAETGAQVGRIALKVRNPPNAPDAGERAALEDFERSVKAGVKETPEHFDAASDGSARYLKAILMQPPCLACHGSTLAPEVKATVAKHYPADQATGFAVGDLRGAFVIDWPSPTKQQP